MCHKLSSSKSPSIQVLHHQFWLGVWVVLVCADSTDAGGVKIMENMLTQYLNAALTIFILCQTYI